MTSIAGREDAQTFLTLASACDAVADFFSGAVTGQEELWGALAGDHDDSNNNVGKISADELASLHHQLFGLNIFPFANVYVSDDLMAGGELGHELADLYAEASFVAPQDVTPDHFGVQFSAAAHLLLTAVEHWRHGNKTQTARALDQLSQLTSRGLLPAMIPVTAALASEEHPIAVNFDLILQGLMCRLAASLAVEAGEPQDPPAGSPDAELPTVAGGLEHLVRFLLTPRHSGFWLSAANIRTLASQLELPCGFSTRGDLLTNLLHAAGTYERVPELLAAVSELAGKRRQHLSNWHSSGQGHIIQSVILLSERRLTQTMRLLEQFRHYADSSHSTL